MSAAVKIAFVRFAKALEAKLREHQQARAQFLSKCFLNGATLPEGVPDELLLQLEVREGPHYFKVLLNRPDDGIHGATNETYVFVDKFTGAVLRPKSYKRPYKSPSGHVLDGDGGLRYCRPDSVWRSDKAAPEERREWRRLVEEHRGTEKSEAR